MDVTPDTRPESAPLTAPSPVEAALSRGALALAERQQADGAWKGDYSGPLFLPPLLVFVHHILGEPLSEARREGLIRYLRSVQNPEGGFGLGEENPSAVFPSVLNYVALRLLGVPKDDADLVRCQTWFLAQGGAGASASWGLFALCLLDLHPWEAIDPVPPETWLLPRRLPVHPGRMWCHSRMVYLPMSWLYGRKATHPANGLVREIRDEIYDRPWADLTWKKRTVAQTDVAVPRGPGLRALLTGLRLATPPRVLREKALAHVLAEVDYEDRITDYICIGPVNKLYNTLVWHFAKPGGQEVKDHLRRLGDYLQEDARGVRMNGYNSSELWDTAFAAQALAETLDVVPDVDALVDVALEKAHGFVDRTQVRQDPPDAWLHWRDPAKGGWPFSTLAHGWPITDCTAEGLKVALLLQDRARTPIAMDRLRDTVNLLLGWQNDDGGWASYEKTRAPEWLERLNPSDAFTNIMIDHSFVECSSAAIQALCAWRTARPDELRTQVDAAVARGIAFLRHRQREDGGWEGAWGVCFTYGTWFATHALRAAGLPATDPAIQRAADFLEANQGKDGGWGEHVDSCRLGAWVATPTGQPVQTAWALLALQAAERRGHAHQLGVAFLVDTQDDDGSWTQTAIEGVFNRTCSIRYHAYAAVFPVRALAGSQH